MKNYFLGPKIIFGEKKISFVFEMVSIPAIRSKGVKRVKSLMEEALSCELIRRGCPDRAAPGRKLIAGHTPRQFTAFFAPFINWVTKQMGLGVMPPPLPIISETTHRKSDTLFCTI